MKDRSDGLWIREWIDSVCDGRVSMSQRTKKSIDDNGGIDAAIAEAKARNVHLALFKNDHDRELVVASLSPFKVLY